MTVAFSVTSDVRLHCTSSPASGESSPELHPPAPSGRVSARATDTVGVSCTAPPDEIPSSPVSRFTWHSRHASPSFS